MKSIFKLPANTNQRYVRVPSYILEMGLSTDAVYLYIWLLDKPEDWDILAPEKLAKQVGVVGRDRCYKALAELEKVMLFVRGKVRNHNGRIVKHIRQLHASPLTEIPEVVEQLPENPEVVISKKEKNTVKTTVCCKSLQLTENPEVVSLLPEELLPENPEVYKDKQTKQLTNKKTSKKDFAFDCEIKKPKYKRWSKAELEKVFAVFWSACPRKIGKVKSREKFEHLIKSHKSQPPKSDPETLTACMVSYARKNQSSEERFILHPTTWLNQERWVDELETTVATNGWGWWRDVPGWNLLTIDDWRGMIEKNKPIDVWPWQKLGPPPGHPECLMPKQAQDAYGDKYLNQVQELIREHGESE